MSSRPWNNASGHDTFIILDGFSGHIIDAIEESCLDSRIRKLTVPAQTSKSFRQLNVRFPARRNSESRRMQARLDLDAKIAKLIRMLREFLKAAIPVSVITNAF
jgi:hypothetical protein